MLRGDLRQVWQDDMEGEFFVSIVLSISTFGARMDEQIVVRGDTARFVAGKQWMGALRSLSVTVPSMDAMLIVVF